MNFPEESQYDFPRALSFDDVLLKPNYSTINSRADIDLTTQISETLTLKIPLISTNMDTITGVEMAIKMTELGGMGILPRFDAPEILIDRVEKVSARKGIAAISIGIKNGYLDLAEKLVTAGATVLDVDVAHGHMQQALEATQALKNKFANKITLLAGIAATAEATDALFNAGADSVMLGVGGGSICTTRIQTGCGVPTFASILESQRIARKHKKSIIPLAGIKNSGDIVKALAVGASAIRGGNIFAGTDACPGDLIEIKGVLYKKYNGSTSESEKKKHVQKKYADEKSTYVHHVEGVEGYVNYKGPLDDHILKLLAGVRSGMSYCGAQNIPELWEKARFIRVTSSGTKENGAHDILVK